MRLDRLLGKHYQLGKRSVRALLNSGNVLVNQSPVLGNRLIGRFDHLQVRDEVLQDRVRRAILLHKPSGVVSATTDAQHQTVLDLIDEPWAHELHLAGRLDRFTTGLVILTNDSSLSEALTHPDQKVGKRYLVNVHSPIPETVLAAFRRGIPLAKEKVITAPAQVTLESPTCCRLTIYEGKHHQIKRMFALFDLRVTALHRDQIGPIYLPADLHPGSWMPLSRSHLLPFNL